MYENHEIKEILDGMYHADKEFTIGILSEGRNQGKNKYFKSPNEVASLAKRLSLDVVPYLKYLDDVVSGKRKKSNVRFKAFQGAIDKSSSLFIVEVGRLHHNLFFMISAHLNKNDDWFEALYKKDNFGTILNDRRTKELFDTDEMNMLRNFNHLRNITIHASSTSMFEAIKPLAYDKLISLLNSLQETYEWLIRHTVDKKDLGIDAFFESRALSLSQKAS